MSRHLAKQFELPLDLTIGGSSGTPELSPDKFDSGWRQRSRIERCSVTDVDAFVKAHYLGKRPAIVMLALRALVRGVPSGMVIFSAPPREINKRYGGVTWELARLYLLDEIPRNAETWLIGRSVRYVKANRPEVQFLVSYADPSVGHTGTIYRAANWRADGKTDDERKSARCDYYDRRTGKKYGRRGNMPPEAVVERRPRVSKFRYFLPLHLTTGGSRGSLGHEQSTESESKSGPASPGVCPLGEAPGGRDQDRSGEDPGVRSGVGVGQGEPPGAVAPVLLLSRSVPGVDPRRGLEPGVDPCDRFRQLQAARPVGKRGDPAR